MLDNFPCPIQTENIHSGIIMIAWPMLMAVQYYEVTFGNSSIDLNALARPFLCHPLEVIDEATLAVRNVGIVLDVICPGIEFDRLARAAVIEHQFVKGDDVSLVGSQIGHNFLH